MKQRIVLAIFATCLALAVFLMRYAPPRAAVYEFGDPVETLELSGFARVEVDAAVLARRTTAAADARIPLVDGRGAQALAVRLHTIHNGVTPLRIGAGAASVVVEATPEYRTYRLITPPSATRHLDLALHAPPTMPRSDWSDISVENLAVAGRGGWPPLTDLLALLLIALIPALLLGLTIRLPLDWALVPMTLALGLCIALPADDWPSLLLFGPFAALVLASITLLPVARAHPAIMLVLIAGAALRCYALGWGSGYAFQPDEQALAANTATGWFQQLCAWTAVLAARLSGNSAWDTPWGMALLGRAWSALAGTILIGAVYALGRLLLRPRWALLAAAFVAVAPVLVQQSHFATPAQFDALLIVMLLLSSVRVSQGGRRRAWIAMFVLVTSIAWVLPQAGVLPIAVLGIHLLRTHRLRSRLRRTMALAALCSIVLLGWSRAAVNAHPATVVEAARFAASAPLVGSVGAGAGAAYGYALFNLLLWSLGPLLMQLGVFGWGVGLSLSLREPRYRPWLPVLLGMGVYFAIVGWTSNIGSFVPLVPLICLTAALLLQTFALRLRNAFGHRTVRMLATTALGLALITSLGLLNVYRSPDPRVAASRWLIAHVPINQRILTDGSLALPLPLGLSHIYADPASPAVTHAAADLAQADYMLLAVEPSDLDLDRLARHDPAAACYYAALFDGRLGFAPTASFAASPHVGGWSLDDSRADLALRLYDHPHVRVYERVATVSPQRLAAELNCGGIKP